MLHSDGDLELDAPNGQVRITARDVVTHATGTHAAESRQRQLGLFNTLTTIEPCRTVS